ncbi:uncharacterized protein [Ptychodera flava]|uniref:uncharacterized protein n=1 Tax=Ptychodera flava TaxID=63121 RepID=UPI00396A9F51
MSRRKQAAPRPIKQIHSELFEDFDNEHGNDHEVKIKEEPLSDSDEFLDEDDDDYDDEEDGNWVIAEDEGSDENFEGNGKYDESLDAANEEDEHKITIETGDSLETEESSEAKDKNSEEDSLEGGSSQFGWSYTYKDGRPMCRYCGRSFMSIGGLKIHSHRCREEKAKRIKEQQPANPNLQCWKCKAIFSTRSSMKRHEKKCGKLYFRSRPMRDMGTTRCNYCKKEFLTRSLMKHLSRCKWLTNSQLKMQYRRVILPKGSDPSRGEITPVPVNSNPSPTSTTAPSKAPKGPTAPIKIAPAQSNSNTPAGSIQSTPGQQPIGALPQLSPALVMAAPGSQPAQVQYIMPVASSAMASSGNTTSPIFVLANVGTNVPAGSVIASNVVPASSNVTNILPSGMTASGMTTLVPVTMVSTTIANVSPSTTKGTAATRVLSATTVKSPTSVTNIACNKCYKCPTSEGNCNTHTSCQHYSSSIACRKCCKTCHTRAVTDSSRLSRWTLT